MWSNWCLVSLGVAAEKRAKSLRGAGRNTEISTFMMVLPFISGESVTKSAYMTMQERKLSAYR